MSRNIPEAVRPATFDELVTEYGDTKAQVDILKKRCDGMNAEIKTRMEEGNLTEYTSGQYTVKYIVSQRVDMNELRLLDVLHRHGLDNLVKTREYVDMDALEAYLYSNEPADDFLSDLDGCKESKDVIQLRVSKAKKKKVEE